MEIEPIPFSAFQTLTNCDHVRGEPDNHGCQWYASGDRSAAGRIYLDASCEAFRFTVLKLVDGEWEAKEPRQFFEDFAGAERALKNALAAHFGSISVTLNNVPMRLRFGRGRTVR